MLALESLSKRPKTSHPASSSGARFDISLKQVTQLPEDIQCGILPPDTLARDILELRRPEARSEEFGKQLVHFRFLKKHLPLLGSDWKNTFLRESIRKNHPAFFHFLFENAGESPNMSALLCTAVWSRNDAAFQALLNRTPVLQPSDLSKTLTCLATYGQPEKLAQLLARQPEGSRPQAADIQKLHRLAHIQQQKIRDVSQLSAEQAQRDLILGIALRGQNPAQYPLHLVALLQHPNLDVNLPTRYENENGWETPLQRAIHLNDMPLFKILLAEPRVSVTAPASETPLHRAALMNRADMLKALLKTPGPEGLVNIRNEDQQTPLHLAVWQGSTEAVKVLLDRPEININPQDDLDMTPLHLFKSGAKQRECVKILLERPETDVNLPDMDGETPLHIAAELGDTALMQMLINNAPKLDVNVRDLQGETPLHRAVHAQKVDSVKALLKAPQLNINIRNAEGLTPLGVASAGDDATLADLLRQHGATE